MAFNQPQQMGPIRPQAQIVQGGPMPMNNMRQVGHMQVRDTSMPQYNPGNDISNKMMQMWRMNQMQQRINQADQRLGNQVWRGRDQVARSGQQVDDLEETLMRLYANQSPLDMTPDAPQSVSTPITMEEPDYLEDIPEDEDDDLPRYDYPRSYP